jgi:pyridinium-3,5-biscarboxylic acid mononucleotide sulfurtransferase
MNEAERLLDRATGHVRGYGAHRAVVAFSGGVDSSVVLSLAAAALGEEAVVAVTATSPSYPDGELDQARAVAAFLRAAHRVVATGEVEREAYARNDIHRCFHCKSELYGVLRKVAATEAGPGTVVVAGANADDGSDFRPGLRAADEQGIRNPLLELGIGKSGVRAMARHLGLPVAEKPALACLSSRVAFGVRITPELLGRIDRAEQAVRALGFDQVRVRHLGDHASIEVPAEEVERLTAHAGLPGVRDRLAGMGWSRVVVDLRGYRSGALNPA